MIIYYDDTKLQRKKGVLIITLCARGRRDKIICIGIYVCYIHYISASEAKLTNRRDSLKFLNVYISMSTKSKMF